MSLEADGTGKPINRIAARLEELKRGSAERAGQAAVAERRSRIYNALYATILIGGGMVAGFGIKGDINEAEPRKLKDEIGQLEREQIILQQGYDASNARRMLLQEQLGYQELAAEMRGLDPKEERERAKRALEKAAMELYPPRRKIKTMR